MSGEDGIGPDDQYDWAEKGWRDGARFFAEQSHARAIKSIRDMPQTALSIMQAAAAEQLEDEINANLAQPTALQNPYDLLEEIRRDPSAGPGPRMRAALALVVMEHAHDRGIPVRAVDLARALTGSSGSDD